eukprot:2806226-Pleurochrysis_carterae.AAC.1
MTRKLRREVEEVGGWTTGGERREEESVETMLACGQGSVLGRGCFPKRRRLCVGQGLLHKAEKALWWARVVTQSGALGTA